MTSSSRRKRPTTRRSSSRTSSSSIKPRPLVAVVIVALALGSTSFSAPASASELQWRRGRASAAKPSRPAGSQQFVQPSFAVRRMDAVVRPAAFEDNGGPQLGSNEQGDVVRSVVVESGEPVNPLRAAQLPPSATPPASAGQPGSQPTDSQLEEELRTPFIETPELPPTEPTPPEDFGVPTPLPEEPQPQVEPQPPIEQPQAPPQPQPLPPPREIQPSEPPEYVPGEELPETAPPLSEATLEAEREKAQEACSQGLTDLKEKTVDKLSLVIAVTGEEGSDYPFECLLEDAWHEGRCWEQTTYLWKASALCHKPLYFEQEQLERYGHSWSPCFAPFCAGAHFFTRLPILPYCMGVEPPSECIYALGHYRPGNCAPYMCNPVPLSPRGALFQAGAVVGAAAALP